MASEGPMVEVGGGVTFFGDEKPVEALLRVEFAGIEVGDALVIARISATGGGAHEAISHLDVQFDLLQIRDSSSEVWNGMDITHNGWIAVGAIDIQKNIQVGNDYLARVTVLGVRGESVLEASDKVEIFVKGAVDILGIGFSKFRGTAKTGLTYGGLAELGAVIAKKFRVAVGEKLDFFASVKDQRFVGYYCHEEYIPGWCDYESGYCQPGYWITDCDSASVVVNGDESVLSKTYLDLAYDLNDYIKLFGSASFVVYSTDVINDEVHDQETNTGFEVLFGAVTKW